MIPAETVEEWATWVEARAEFLREVGDLEDDADLADLRIEDAEDAEEIAKHLRQMDVGSAVEKVAYLDSVERDTYYDALDGFREATGRILDAQAVADRAEAGEREAAARQYQSDLAAINRHRRRSGQAELDPAAAGWGPQDVAAEAARIAKRNPAQQQLKRRLMR